MVELEVLEAKRSGIDRVLQVSTTSSNSLTAENI